MAAIEPQRRGGENEEEDLGLCEEEADGYGQRD